MPFTQKIFTSFHNYPDGDTRIGEKNRIWYSSVSNTLRIQLDNTPGGTIISSGTGFVQFNDLSVTTTTASGGGTLAYNDNGVFTFAPADFTGLATETWVTNQSYLTGADLGNLSIGNQPGLSPADTNLQTVLGSIGGADIAIVPDNASVFVPKLKIAGIATLTTTASYIETFLTSYRLVSIVDYSTGVGDDLIAGSYGITNTVGVPWTVFELAATGPTPVNAIALGDTLTGLGIIPSKVAGVGYAGVGEPVEWSSYIVVDLDLTGLGQILPIANALFSLSRPYVKNAFKIETDTDTDIFLNPSPLGDIVANANVMPLYSNTYTLGSPSQRFKEIFIGAGTIYILDETTNRDIAIGSRDGNLYIQNAAGLVVGEFTLVDNQILITDPGRDILIGTSGSTASVVFNRAIEVKDSLGRLAFEVDRTGNTSIYSPAGADPLLSTLNIIGTANTHVQPRDSLYDGTMIHLTAIDGKSSRISSDSFGTGVYPLYVGRAARGTVDTPAALESGDVISRMAASGYGTSQYMNGIARIDTVAAETFSDTQAGTKFTFQTTPLGGTNSQLSATVNSTGLSFSGTADIQAGITFRNGDRLTYFPTPAGQTDKWLKSNGTAMSWQALPTFSGAVVYKGSWNASTNLPELTNTTAGGEIAVVGWEYSISVTGEINIGAGFITYEAGGFVIFNGTNWEYIPPTSGVTSIQFDSGAAQTGPVTVYSSDIISTLASSSIDNVKLANSSVTVTAGTGMSGGGTVALGATITLTNAGVRAITTNTGLSTNTNATGSITVTNTGIITLSGSTYINVTSGSNPTISLQQYSSSATANMLALRDSVGGIDAIDFTASQDVSVATNHGAFNYGALSYSDVNIMADFSYDINKYNQIILQNRNSGGMASTNYIVSNDQGTSEVYYGEFGMNSSGFTTDGSSLTLPNAVYLNSVSSDLILGGKNLHIVANDVDVVKITDTEINTYNNYVLKDGSDNVLLQLQNEGGIGKLKFNGGSQGIWYDGGVVINGVGYHADYTGIQPLSYNSATGQVTYGQLDYSHFVGFPRPPRYANDTAANLAISLVTPGGDFYNTPQAGQMYFDTTVHLLKTYSGTAWVSSVASVTATGPISSSGGTTPNISISQASGSTSGYLSSTDWTTFNNKTSNTGTVTSIATSGTVSGLTLTGGTITTTGTITLGGTISGLTTSNLSSTAGIVNSQLANSTISGVALGGNLSTLTISGPLTGTSYNGSTAVSIGISQASGSVNGYLSSTDWTTFNNKTSNTGTVTSVAAITLTTTGTDITSTVATGTTTPVITLNVPTASASNRGLLSSTDWTTFNNKTSNTGTVTSITASTTPVNGLSLSGGAITTSGTVAITGTLSGITNSNLSGTAGITNANLANSSVTVTAGTGMTGGGSVSLGGSVTLTNAGVTSIVAGTNVTVSGSTGAVTINAASNGVGGNQLVYVLNGSLSYPSAKNTLTSIFGLTSGVTLTTNTRYQYEMVVNMAANKAGVLSYALALGGSAAVAQHNYTWQGNKTTTIDGYTAGITMMSYNATGANITAANAVADTSTFTHHVVYGTIDVTTGGTVNFMVSQDQNTPITWLAEPGSYIKLLPVGPIGANTADGTWA